MILRNEHGSFLCMRNVSYGEYYLAKDVDRELRRKDNLLYSFGYVEPVEEGS